MGRLRFWIQIGEQYGIDFVVSFDASIQIEESLFDLNFALFFGIFFGRLGDFYLPAQLPRDDDHCDCDSGLSLCDVGGSVGVRVYDQ